MSNYLGMETVKPSKPIKRGDLYVFPKTTASQVIVDENTDERLDGTINSFSNANLLVNSDFKINQRGQTRYDNSKSSIVHTVDRWRINGLVVTVNSDGSVTVANSTAENARNFMQVFADHLMDEVYTASCKVKSVSGQVRMFYGSFGNNLAVGVNKFTFPKASTNMFIFQLAVGASVTLEWVKLEQGSVATPFVAPLPSDELIRCGSPDDSSELGYKAGFLSEADVVDNLESNRADLPLSARMGNELNKNLGKDLLWKNNDTLSSSYNFPAQSIQIEGITNYSMVMIVFTLFVNSSGGYLPKHIVVDEGFYGKQCHAMHTQAGTDMSAVSWSRPFTINEHGVVFENAKVTTGTTEQSNSTRWIPMSIYGIK